MLYEVAISQELQQSMQELGLLALGMAFRRAIKHEVRTRQEGRCDNCGAAVGTGLQTHHIKPESLGGSSERIENAVGLCQNCHKTADDLAFKGVLYPQRHNQSGYMR